MGVLVDAWIEVAHIKDLQDFTAQKETEKQPKGHKKLYILIQFALLSAPNQVVQTSSYWTEMPRNICSLFKSQNCTAEHTNAASKCDILNDLF
jgi:hypothetical protein